MNLKLRIASYWMPKSTLIKELDRVAQVTILGLDNILEKYDPEVLEIIKRKKKFLEGDIHQRRIMMAEEHNIRVKALINILGYEKGIKLGREAMFKAGLELGREAKKRLGVDESFKDLILAAKILYNVLGINFTIKKNNKTIKMLINHCSLADYYTPETCRVLSAADEGVVHGLNESINMVFKERITEGAPECIAHITGD
jgi:hypothetical protein